MSIRNADTILPTPEITTGSFVSRLRSKLNRGDSFLTYDLATLLSSRALEESDLEDIETRLLLADVGVEATEELMSRLHIAWRKGEIKTSKDLRNVLELGLHTLLSACAKPLALNGESPFVIMMVGINGAGKTTTVGKIAAQLRQQGHSVLLAAGDTFRAAAVEQLSRWGERLKIPVILQGSGADPASVIFDATQAAKARKIGVVLADTAGRLHTQTHLMEELKKIKRVLQKIDPSYPQEVLLVLDATIGSNTLQQLKQFNDAVGVTGLVITKLDGTAKGGIVLALAKQFKLPIRFIGVGEGVDDLGRFDPREFITALLDGNATK